MALRIESFAANLAYISSWDRELAGGPNQRKISLIFFQSNTDSQRQTHFKQLWIKSHCSLVRLQAALLAVTPIWCVSSAFVICRNGFPYKGNHTEFFFVPSSTFLQGTISSQPINFASLNKTQLHSAEIFYLLIANDKVGHIYPFHTGKNYLKFLPNCTYGPRLTQIRTVAVGRTKLIVLERMATISSIWSQVSMNLYKQTII